MPLSETVLITVLLLGVAVLAAAACRRVPVPFTALLVLLGIGLGWLDQHWLMLEPLQSFHLSPDLVLFVFLPALIFESGFNLDGRQLLKDIVPVFSLAVPALLISTALIGAGLWWLLGMEPFYALLFGALISATDPIAVIALFKELGAPLRLNVLVEGESLLNDATALVVFKVLLGIAAVGSMQWSELGNAAGEFVRVFFGGALVGFMFGIVCSELMRFVQSRSAVFTLTVVMAYTSFIISEHLLHMSGVMAVVVSAIFLSILGRSRMTQEVAETAREIWEFIAYLCNALLFLLVGLSVDPAVLMNHVGAIMVAILLVIAVRAITVHSMVPLVVNWFKLPPIGMPERQIMWWGGLKGSLAIAMALSIPEEVPGREMIMAMTVGVVVFTLLVNASTIRTLMHTLGMDRLDLYEKAELNTGLRRVEQSAQDVVQQFRSVGVVSKGASHNISDEIHGLLTRQRVEIEDQDNERNLYLSLLYTEMGTLDSLYEAGIVPQYTRIELRQQIQAERDRLYAGATLEDLIEDEIGQEGLFARAEQYLLGKIREWNWSMRLLTEYQYMRLSQHFRRDVARLMMVESSIRELEADDSMSKKMQQELLGHLKGRKGRLESMLADFKRDMPEFYRRYSYRIASQAAWSAAIAESDMMYQHGQVGGKAFARLHRLILRKLESLPSVSEAAPESSMAGLVSSVPLFSGLSEEVVNEVVTKGVVVTFLSGDMVIGEGEHGDALYIVIRGLLRVHRDAGDEEIAHLDDGDFFGEMALLGDQVRNVNVTAVHACELLRIRRGDVLALAERFPQISQRLHEVEQDRRSA